MIMNELRKNVAFACVTVGLVLLASKYRNNVLQSVQHLCQGITKSRKKSKDQKDKMIGQRQDTLFSLDKVILADTPEKCDYAIQRIHRNISDGVLGFDCEWVNEGPVALIQLSTRNGVCALFRLSKLGHVPNKLKELLMNRRLIKVGVGCFDDGERVTKDYNCQVFGTVDVRTLASHFSLPCPESLSSLCMEYLGTEMVKVRSVRCGNWNAEELSTEQIAYAAYDAHVSVLIFYKILQRVRQNRSLWKSLILYIKNMQSHSRQDGLYDLPFSTIDTRFKSSWYKRVTNTQNENVSNNIVQTINRTNDQVIKKINDSEPKSSVPTRNKPLYHNCYLQAPDGDILCTCDRKKADWYVSKGLGEVVLEDPFTVKLKFEPSGRALGDVGKYYTQVKVNQCVVCGSDEKFVRKNVVPREYRKYFPLVMKSHQSHDVLLLCPSCHEVSNCHDLQFRRKLASLCNAPLVCPVQKKNDDRSREWQTLKSAVKALKDGSNIPPGRRRELEHCIQQYSGCEFITSALLKNLEEQLYKKISINDVNSNKPNFPPHGQKVVQFFESQEGGLVELEKLWREHFLTTMKPKFLPELWSISHNQERLNIRQSQNRIEPSDAKVAGIR
ncbi:hypothetical protein TKK_0017871 [Trichogramma kaykai]|uniref:3'-5' exonuclease domain-containing protein n=1 Tax=Trichogramma kaykai TaxID=54128 RepID=A0ABD2W0Z4_9HYME